MIIIEENEKPIKLIDMQNEFSASTGVTTLPSNEYDAISQPTAT